MGSTFKEVRERVDLRDVASWLGISRGHDTALCPFHSDNHPSLKLYADHFHCFVCGAHGDSVALTSKTLNVRPIEAVGQLNNYFQLGLNLNSDRVLKKTKTHSSDADKFKVWWDEVEQIVSRAHYDLFRNGADESLLEDVASLHDAILQTPPKELFTNLIVRERICNVYYRKLLHDRRRGEVAPLQP